MGRQQILLQIGFVSQKIGSGEFAPRERHNSRRSAPQTIELQIFDRVAVEIIRDGANFRSIYRCNCMEPVELQRKFCSFRSIYRCKCMEPRIITTGILQSRSIYRCNSMGPVQIPLDLGIAAVYFPLIANFGSVEIVRNLRGFGGLNFAPPPLL